MMWVAPLLKGTASLIISGVAINKIMEYTSGDTRPQPKEELNGAYAIYERSWFDKNMLLLALSGLFCGYLIFYKKK